MSPTKPILSTLAVLASAITVLGAVVPDAAQAQGRPFEGVTLRVATFGGPWRDDLVKHVSPKLEAMGAKVEYVIGSPQDNLAKIIAARGRDVPFDVVEVLDAQVDQAVDAGFLRRIDYSKIPNIAQVEDWARHPNAVGNWLTQEVICYDKGKFAELGLPAPTSYRDLADPKLANRVMLADITGGGGLANFAGMTYAAGGDTKNVRPGLDLIRTIKGAKFWKAGGDVVTGFKSGDIWAAVAHTGWCLRAIKFAGANVASAHPRISDTQRGVIKVGWLGIVEGTKNQAAAEAFVNAYLDEEFQVAFAKNSGVWPVNKRAAQRLRTEDPVFVALNLIEPAEMNRMLRIDYKGVNINSWYDQWNRAISR
jgi:putative spermidine/putrescine transport system substrate-binding protein